MRIYPAFMIIAGTLCVPLIAQPVHAQKAKNKKTSSVASGSSQAQVDGISTRVVDHLWDYTDKYYHDGDYNRIIGLCRVVVEREPSFDEAYENASYLLWSQGDTDAADAFLEYGLKHSKDQMNLLFEFGRHLMTTKRPEAALPYLKKASEMPNAGPRVFAQLGHCYEKNKKYEDAVAAWSTLVKKFPTFPSGPPNLARVKKLLAGGT